MTSQRNYWTHNVVYITFPNIERFVNKGKSLQYMRNRVGLYNKEKMLMCGAQVVRAYNTAGVDADTQAALRSKSTVFKAGFPVVGLTRRLCIDPHSMSENAALEGTPLTSFTASPLKGRPSI